MSTLQELRIKNRERSRVWNHGGLHHMTHEEKDDLIELLFRALELGGRSESCRTASRSCLAPSWELPATPKTHRTF
jgi:hypothetical protein